MPNRNAETTRLLCASAYLSGATFRSTILDRVRQKHKAVAPELGVDLGTVAQVCRIAERRSLYFSLGFVLVMVVASFTALLTNPEQAIVPGIVLVLLSAILFFVMKFQERYSLTRPFLRKHFTPEHVATKYPSDGNHSHPSQTEQNLVIYSGFTPFVGAGIDFGGWSFAVSTIKCSEEYEDDPAGAIKFSPSDLYVEIEAGIDSLALERVKSHDFYFVSGTDIRADHEILPDDYSRPAMSLSAETAASYKDNSDSHVRFYRWIRVEDWGGELVFSMFLRCTLRGSNLFVELRRFLLTPVAHQYRAIDRITPPNFSWVVLLIIGSLIAGPLYAIISPLVLLHQLALKVNRMFGAEDKAMRKEIRENPLFDYGASESLRAKFSSGAYHHYFQKVDTDFYGKVLESGILDSIFNFLDKHHIDTSAFKENRKTILNSGVIVHGDINTDNMAVGMGAKAIRAGEKLVAKAKGAEA
jgi:hypothetical protein